MGSDGSIEGVGFAIGGGSSDVGREGWDGITKLANGGGSGCIARDGWDD
jgi:hypothetical protein